MTVPFPPMFISPFNFKRYNVSAKLMRQNSEPTDTLLRAQSVCLSRRPQSVNDKRTESAIPDRFVCSQKDFYLESRNRKLAKLKFSKSKNIPVVARKKTPPNRTPCAMSVKMLSIPMTYDSDACSLSKRNLELCNRDTKTKVNLRKQVAADKKPSFVTRGRETENKLLIQISEADKVSDFERILNSNAILRQRQHAVRADVCSANPPSVARPRSHYSVSNVSEAYNYLFQRHIDSVQQLIDDYKNTEHDKKTKKDVPSDSILGQHWSDDIQHLSEFYDDDTSLKEELHSINDQIIDEEVKQLGKSDQVNTVKNFNVNLSGLIIVNSFDVHGDDVSDHGLLTPDFSSVKAYSNEESDEEKEWDALIMSDKNHYKENESVANIAQHFNNIDLDKNTNVPKITFSNCCDNNARSDSSNKTTVNINLTVPSIEKSIEARPPI